MHKIYIYGNPAWIDSPQLGSADYPHRARQRWVDEWGAEYRREASLGDIVTRLLSTEDLNEKQE